MTISPSDPNAELFNESPSAPAGYRFDDYRLCLRSLRLERDGVEVPLQPQPARLLALLLEHAPGVVSREVIRREIWGDDRFLDVDPAINFAVRRVRAALGDSAAEPRFVETVPREGYRLLVVPTALASSDSVAPEVSEVPEPTRPIHVEPAVSRARIPRQTAAWAAVFVLALSLFGAALGLGVVRDAADDRADDSSALRRTLPPELHDLYVQGRYLVERHTVDESAQGLELIRRVTAAAPDFAPALLAEAEGRLWGHDGDPFETFMPAMEELALRALSRTEEPEVRAEAHRVVAMVRFWHHRDDAAAAAAIERALALVPDDPESLQLQALFASARGEHARSIEVLRRAVALDPASMLVRSDLSAALLYAGLVDEAVDAAEDVLEVAPRDGYSHALRATALLVDDGGAGSDGAARRALCDWLETGPDCPTIDQSLRLRLEQIEARRAEGRRSHADRALVEALRGRPEAALTQLEIACAREPEWLLPFVPVDPRFASVRRLPGFDALEGCFPA